MYKCCIFDLDGTLINSIKAIAYTANLTLKKYGLGPVDEENYKLFVGDGYKKLIERALIYCGDKNLNNYEDAIVTYSNYFKIHSMHGVKAYDGIESMLSYLKEKNIKVAVLSNKPHARAIDNVNEIFGYDFFDIVCGEKDNIKIKPDPEGALNISNQLSILQKDCLYFGDTNTDMKTGINAGMDTVGVTWGFRKREELESYRPKYIIDKPEEIIEIIEGKK